MPEPDIGKVPFTESLEHFKNKGIFTTKHWDEVLGEQHSRAFTIAGVTRIEMLNDFKKALEDIRARGGTLTDFRKEFDIIVDRYGWPYKGTRGWRSRIIFETNNRTSAAAGRWAQIERRQAALKKRDPNATLYLEYRVLDHAENRRPEHQAWDGIILPIDHWFWETHYPPNGFGCACTVIVRTKESLERLGKKVTPDSELPDMTPTSRINQNSGEIYPPTPPGVDVGFDHNHGRSAYLPNGANIVDARLGHQLAEIVADSLDFERFVKGEISGNSLVGFLPDGLPDLINAKTNRVFLSSESMKKQLSRHPELTLSEYRYLPSVFSSGLVIQDSGQTLLFFHVGDRIYRAVVKATSDGSELYLTSLTRSNARQIKSARDKGEVVREEI